MISQGIANIGGTHMEQTVFRKTSIDRLKSPDQLNEYIRVATPGVWLILAAVVLLLVGVIVWGIFGSIPFTVSTGAVVQDGSAVCCVSEEDAAQLEPGMTVTVDGVQGTVTQISETPIQLNETVDSYFLSLCGFSAGDFCYVAQIHVPGLSDGVYPAEMTVGTIHPISFVIQ